MGKIRLSSKSSALNYPELKPTLNLNFAASKSLDPRITFTRNSIGTYVGSDGLIKTAVANEPRFEHDPVTGECLGLLLEESRTNYLYPSTTGSSGGSWGNQGAPLISNAGMSPDGTNTAILTAWNTVSESERIYYDTGTPLYVGVTEIHSFFIKSAQYGSRFTATFQGVNWSWINGLTNTKGFTFDFDAETLSVNTGLISSYGTTVIKYNNGWYRICIPAINNGNGGFANTYVYFGRASQVGNWYIWGCQREVGTYPTSYIPTSGSTVTRQADVAQITGTNFSSWYNSTEGTLLSIGETPASYTTSSSLVIKPYLKTVSNLLYYPKTIQYPTLKSINAYSSIVGNGLVLHLDAGNTISYSGSGTTWTDLSGLGNNGTLTNGPTYSSANGGSIVFDGTDDYALVNSNSSIIPYGSSTRTINIWFYTNSTTWASDVNNLFFYGAGSIGNAFGIDMDVYPKMEVYTWGNIGRDLTFNTTYSQDGWKNITVTYNGSTTILIYENAVFTQRLNLTSSCNTTTSDVYIGAINPSALSGGYFNGNIAQVSIYNRALSAAEIQQNFNATRGRFGL